LILKKRITILSDKFWESFQLDATKDNKIVAIEILDASQKLSVRELFKFEVEKQAA